MEVKVQGRRKKGIVREDGWIELGMISERKDCRGRKCTTELH